MTQSPPTKHHQAPPRRRAKNAPSERTSPLLRQLGRPSPQLRAREQNSPKPNGRRAIAALRGATGSRRTSATNKSCSRNFGGVSSLVDMSICTPVRTPSSVWGRSYRRRPRAGQWRRLVARQVGEPWW